MTLADLWARIEIADVSAGDASRMATVHGEAFDRGWSEDEMVSLLSGRGVFALGLWRKPPIGRRHLAGFALLRVAAGEAEVLTVAVRQDERGRGYGRRLMEEALRRLYRDRIETCYLEVDPGNRAAVGLYRSLGFEPFRERKRYYGDSRTALVMRLDMV